jgi:hypothetical protein
MHSQSIFVNIVSTEVGRHLKTSRTIVMVFYEEDDSGIDNPGRDVLGGIQQSQTSS